MEKINFENASIITPAKVTINGTDYEVTPAQLTIVQNYLSAETLNDMQDNIEDEIEGEVLFTGNSYSNVTLSQSINNCKYLDIFFADGDGANGFTRVFNALNKLVCLQTFYISSNDNTVYFKNNNIRIGSTSISVEAYKNWYIANATITDQTSQGTNSIAITKVVGYY